MPWLGRTSAWSTSSWPRDNYAITIVIYRNIHRRGKGIIESVFWELGHFRKNLHTVKGCDDDSSASISGTDIAKRIFERIT